MGKVGTPHYQIDNISELFDCWHCHPLPPLGFYPFLENFLFLQLSLGFILYDLPTSGYYQNPKPQDIILKISVVCMYFE